MMWIDDQLAEMYLAVERMVRKVMSRFPDDMDDVMQEAKLQVWLERRPDNGPAWAATVGRNRAIDFIRRRDRAKEGLLSDGNAGWVPDPRPEWIDPVDCFVALVRSMRAAPARGPRKREVVAAIRRTKEQNAAAKALGMSRGTLNNYVADIRRYLVEEAITEREAHAAIEFMLDHGLSEDWEELIAYLKTLCRRSEPIYFFLGEDRVREEFLAQEVARRLRGLEAQLRTIYAEWHRLFGVAMSSEIDDRLPFATKSKLRAEIIQVWADRQFPYSWDPGAARVCSMFNWCLTGRYTDYYRLRERYSGPLALPLSCAESRS